MIGGRADKRLLLSGPSGPAAKILGEFSTNHDEAPTQETGDLMRVRFSRSALLALWKKTVPVAQFLAGSALAFAIGFWFASNTSDAIRYAGLVLQVMGVLTVVFLLFGLRRLFGHSGIWKGIREWFSLLRLVVIEPDPITAIAGVATTSFSVLAAGVLTTSQKGKPLHQRITLLEEAVSALRTQIDSKLADQRKSHEKELARIRKELSALRKQLKEMAAQLQAATLGDSHLEVVGLAWLILGVLAATIPSEIAGWLRWVAISVQQIW